MRIRKEEPSDAAAIEAITIAAFQNAAHTSHTEQFIVRAPRNAGQLAELRALGAAGCVVLGEPGYYSRFGFNAEPSLVLPGVPAEYFQAISFNGSLPTGVVSYHDSFAAKA